MAAAARLFAEQVSNLHAADYTYYTYYTDHTYYTYYAYRSAVSLLRAGELKGGLQALVGLQNEVARYPAHEQAFVLPVVYSNISYAHFQNGRLSSALRLLEQEAM